MEIYLQITGASTYRSVGWYSQWYRGIYRDTSSSPHVFRGKWGREYRDCYTGLCHDDCVEVEKLVLTQQGCYQVLFTNYVDDAHCIFFMISVA